MKELFSKISNGIKRYQSDLILAIGVILISLLSFAMGYITAKTFDKEPIKIENNLNLRMELEYSKFIVSKIILL